jgi:hypothetical protein
MVPTVNKDLYNIKEDSKYRGCEEMHAPQALRTLILVFILTIGSVLPALVSPPVSAQSTQKNTTLYFTNALDLFTGGDVYNLSFAPISANPPTNQFDSQYPPNILVKNDSKLIPKLNSDQLLAWGSTVAIYFLQGIPGFNLSDLYAYLGNTTLSGYDLSLLFPNPFRVVESYTYTGENPVKITGNLTFNLFFSPPTNKPKKYQDNVTVGLYSMNENSFFPLPKLIKNASLRLAPKILFGIYKQQVTLPDVDYTLKPGESLLFSVEIVPTEKRTILFDLTQIPFIKKLTQLLLPRWENFTSGHLIRRTIGEVIKNITTFMEDSGVNVTPSDIRSLISMFKSSQFIYDSLDHPSSVAIPAKISEEDFRVYYLHADQTMSETQPTGAKATTKVLSNKNQTIWTADESLDRNKMLVIRNTTLEVYLQKLLFLIRPFSLQLNATLYDNGVPITSVQKKITLKEIKPILGKPKKPIIISFNGSAIEVAYGHQLEIGLSVSKSYILKPKLLCDSTTYPSFLRVKYEDTDNIQVSDVSKIPSSGLIIPGGLVEYLVNVSSKKADNITISSIVQDKTGGWSVTAPSVINVSANSITTIPVILNSTDVLKKAYGNSITTTLVITGKTGIAKTSASADVSRDAIQYDIVLLDYQNNITMKKGETKNFYFTIKNNNTGALDDVDNYTIDALSQNGWQVIPLESIKNIRRGETSPPNGARVVIEAPANTTLDSDVITVTVTSETDPTTFISFTFTVNIQPPDILQSIYNSLNSVAKSLGLTDIFGDYAAIALTALIMIIILFIIIILAFVLTLKDVDIICTNRIKEIEPDQQAVFELSLRNPTRKQQSYDVTTKHTADPSQWVVTTEPASLQVEGRQKQPVLVLATPAETIRPKDWTEITVNVQRTGKKKTAHIDLMAMIKEGTTILQIGNVTHWPSEFTPGERIVTSFSISNKGTIVARDVTVFFYLNGKQKNKVTVTIPAGAVADVQMPWIALKGRNKVRIRLKEQQTL